MAKVGDLRFAGRPGKQRAMNTFERNTIQGGYKMQQQFDCRLAWVDTEVLKDKTFSPCDKTVYSIICVHASPQTRECALKVKTMAEETNCSIRSVQESLKALAQRGVIERRENFENGQQKASIYRIVGCLASCYKRTGEEIGRL
jgi:hypothetical protein